MEEAEQGHVSSNPIVAELREAALKPYERVLPQSVLVAFGNVLEMILEAHPIGSDLVTRLSPGLSDGPELTTEASSKGFQAFAIIKKTLAHIRDTALEEERAQFFWCPEGSYGVLSAFLNHFCPSDSASVLSEHEARVLGHAFADAVVASLFLGLIRDMDDHPTLAR